MSENVIVTGASRGIGKYIAEHFNKLGYNLALVALEKNELKETVRELKNQDSSNKIIFRTANSSVQEEVQNTVEYFIKEFNQIHILINNAGMVGPTGYFWENDLNLWKRTIEVNLFGMATYSYYVLKNMILSTTLIKHSQVLISTHQETVYLIMYVNICIGNRNDLL